MAARLLYRSVDKSRFEATLGHAIRLLRSVAVSALVLLATLFMASDARAGELVRFKASTPWLGTPLELQGALFGAGEGRRPAVVLLHGCGGLQPTVRKSLVTHANHLVRHGFAALILDSFGPRRLTGGRVCSSNGMLQAAIRYRSADARDAARYLGSRKDIDARNLFAMGQSNGGSVVLTLAGAGRASGFSAIVAYYSWCSGSGGHALPVLIFSGGADDWTPAPACERRRGGRTSVIVYPNAVHSFDVPVEPQLLYGHRIGYDAAATADSRIRMAAFLRRHLVP